jgi:anti-sigma factor RsiW
MNCEMWQDKIDSFVDFELDATETREFEEHMRACPACSAETLSRQRLKIETRLAAQRFAPTAAFEARVRSRFKRRPTTAWWLPALGAALAAMIVLTWAATELWKRNATRQELVSQIVDQHATTVASNNPVDVISSDQHTVKPWFQGKVPFGVEVPSLEGTDFSLIGGRVAYVQQAPAAQLVFGLRKHRISVFIMRESNESANLGTSVAPSRRSGYQTETWKEDGVRYFAVGDVSAEDLHRLCDLLLRNTES